MSNNFGQGGRLLGEWFGDFSPSISFSRDRLLFTNINGPLPGDAFWHPGTRFNSSNPFVSDRPNAPVSSPGGQTFNTFNDTINFFVDGGGSGGQGPQGPEGPPGPQGPPGLQGPPGSDGIGINTKLFVCRNVSGSTINRFEVAKVTGPLFDPSSDPADFLDSPSFTIDKTHDNDETPGHLVIANEDIPNNENGLCYISGLVPIRADVTNADHTHLRAVSGEPRLQSCYQGVIPIIWKESGTGNSLYMIVALEPAYQPLSIWARILGSTPVGGGDNRWTYTWEEVLPSGTNLIQGDRDSSEDGVAYNLIEQDNDDTGIQGNGIDLDNLGGTFENVPLGAATVRLFKHGTTWYFSNTNLVDGGCEDPE